MIKIKRFKDPVYGYIDIKEFIISDIVDTSGFQRLRHIIQTSYSPLYSSAVHNRFVHSLGVYYLGCIAVNTLTENRILFEEIENLERMLEVFKKRANVQTGFYETGD